MKRFCAYASAFPSRSSSKAAGSLSTVVSWAFLSVRSSMRAVAAPRAARRELALDGRARLGEPARTPAHEREPDDSRDCPRRPHRHGYGLKMSTPTSTTLLEPLFSAQ